MTLRRTAVLAQATALLVLLAPGLHPGGVAVSRAAVDAYVDTAETSGQVLDAAGKGIGCTSKSRFKGPKVPGVPPPPPGSKPSPSPSATPFADGGLEAGEDGETTAAEPTALLSAKVRSAQADPTEPPAGTDDAGTDDAGTDEVIAPAEPGQEPSTRRGTRQQARAAGLTAGLDVSHWQGAIDWGQVKKKNRQFVFIKATESTTFVDPMFASHMAPARSAGLSVGAYHVFDYTIDGKAQADHFIDRLQQVGGLDGALPPVVDVECFSYMGFSTHVAAEARLRDFVQRVYQRTARLPIIYTSVFMWSQVVGDSERFSRSPLWAACWGCDLPPSLAPGWDDWTFWQTGVDTVPGVGRLDGNFFSGSKQELNRLKLKPLRLDNGRAATGDTRVNISLGGRDAVQVRSSLDGDAWSPWRDAKGRLQAELDATEGEQTVFVQLRAGPGMRSEVFSDAITLDLTGPSVSEPAVTLREGPIRPAAVPIAVSWVASDDAAGLSDGAVEVRCGSNEARSTEAPGSAAPGEAAAWLGEATLGSRSDCSVTVIGRDGVGNETRAKGPTVAATIVSERPSDMVSYEGAWQERDHTTALGGSLRTSASDGATVSATVGGRHVGIVAHLGPAGGRAEVLIDGEMVGLIDTYSPTASDPQLVFTTPSSAARLQRLTIRPLGTADPSSTDAQVAIDGFVVLS